MSIRLMELVFKLPATIGPDERAILMPLANEARDDGHCGKWSPEIADIAAASGMSKRSVQRYLKDMSDGSPEACARRGLPPLVEVTPRFGPNGKGGRQRGNYYRLRLPGMAVEPETRGVSDCHPSMEARGDIQDALGVTDCHPSAEARGDNVVTPGVTGVSPPYKKARSSPVTTTPQPPAPAGGGSAASQPEAEASAATARRRVDAAYSKVFTTPPPRAWQRAVTRELNAGGAELLAQATDADVREGQRRAKARKPSPGVFGFGWFLGALRDRLATAAENDRAAAARTRRAEDRRRRAAEEREAEAEARRQRAERRRHFDELPADVQNEFLRRADAELEAEGSAFLGASLRRDRAETLAWAAREPLRTGPT